MATKKKRAATKPKPENKTTKWGVPVNSGKPKRHRKRKKTKGSTNPTTVRLELYITEERRPIVRKLARLAAKKGVSKSAIMLQALEAFLENA